MLTAVSRDIGFPFMSSSFLILISAFFGACETALIRSIGTTHDFFELMTAQYLGVSILCALWMLKTRTSFFSPCWRLQLTRGCTGLCASVSAIILAQEILVCAAQCMLYTSPFFILLIMRLMNRERSVGFLTLLAVLAVGFGGAILVLDPTAEGITMRHLILGGLLGLAAACSTLLLRAVGHRKEPVVRTTFYLSTFCFIAGIIGGFFYHDAGSPLLCTEPKVLLVGLFVLIVQLCRAGGWKYGNWFVNSVFYFSGIPFAAILGWILFDEGLGIEAVLGIALIIAASAAATVIERRKSVKKDAPAAAGKRSREVSPVPAANR